MKNNEWNIPSDYFEKNKKILMPVRKFPTGKLLLALAAACVIGVGFFMWKGDNRTQEIAQGERREEEVREGKIENEKQNENESLVKRGEEKRGERKMGEVKRGEEEVREGKIENEKQNENESLVKSEEEMVREGKRREEIVKGLEEISREELVAYLLEEDSDFIENID
jgi:flagellar biosynthesis GTPase FlhF